MAYPVIRPKPGAKITTNDVLAVLRLIWSTTTETADRLGTRMERILDYATTHDWRRMRTGPMARAPAQRGA